MTNTPAIELRDVSVTYNQGTPDEVTALNNISLKIAKGETIIITGGNGSGKSTLLKAVSGTAPVTSGTVLINGADVTRWPAHRRARLLAFIHQDPMLSTCPNLTVHENFRLVTAAPWWSLLPERLHTDPSQAALVASSGLPLDRKAASLINSLSGGQRQGAALVLALSSKRPILLMDEFTSSLDFAVRQAYLDIIGRETARCHLTIVAVLHHLHGTEVFEARRLHLEAGAIHDLSLIT